MCQLHRIIQMEIPQILWWIKCNVIDSIVKRFHFLNLNSQSYAIRKYFTTFNMHEQIPS